MSATEKIKKERIDKLLVDLGLVPTRQKAQALVMAGLVLVDDVPVKKAGHLVSVNSAIRVKGEEHPFVGRGGVKIAHALDHFEIDPSGKTCMDVGSSTGGFTDCLLQRGAKKVYAIDVGYGQMAYELTKDERVVLIERTNIRTMDPLLVPDPIELSVIDVSFISLDLVLPKIDRFMAEGAYIVALVKPQFEVRKGEVDKGGIVRDPVLHSEAISRVEAAGKALAWKYVGVDESPILGAKGNKEFLICFRK